MTVSTILLLFVAIAISIGFPIALTIGVVMFLITAAARFPAESRLRTVAMFVAVASGIASALVVAYLIYELYRPVFSGETGATNGIILFLGPGIMSVYALIPAGILSGILMLWSWALRKKTKGT